MKGKTFDKIFVGVLAIVLLLGIYIQYNKIPVWNLLLSKKITANELSLLFSNNKESIGSVSSLEGNLQRKKNDEYSFEYINKSQDVFFKDTFLTNRDTRAKITLNNGLVIVLEPSTMIKLDFSDSQSWLSITKKPMITVIAGSVQTVQSKNIQEKEIIKVIKKPIIVKKSEPVKELPAVLLVDKPQNYEQIKKAAPKFEYKDSPVEEKASREIAISPLPEQKELPPVVAPQPIQAPPVAQLPPKINNINIIYNVMNAKDNSNRIKEVVYDEFKTSIKWSMLDGKDLHYHLVIYDTFHKNMLLNVSTKANSYIYDSYIVPDYSIIKVKAYTSDQKLVGESSKVLFKFNYNPPIVKNPRNNSVNDLTAKGKENLIVSWESTNFTKEYKVEVSSSPNFDRDLKTTISKNNYIVLNQKSGTYYLRVKSINNYFESSWTDIIRYQIVNN